MKSNTFKYTKKSLIAFIVFFTFHISIVKSYATVLKINEIKKSESIFAVSFSSNPAADNGTITICEGQTITYTNTSTGVGTNPAFAWSFPGGNNTSETTEGPHTITYNNAGNFTTTLTIDGTSSNVNVVVNAGPNPSFSLGPNWGSTTFNNTTYFSRCGINSGNVNFTFSTDTQNTNSNTQHIINWGDGGPVTTFTGTNISSDFHNYPRGLYTINYTVTLENGCSTTKTFNVFIGASPSASVGTAGTPTLCDPSNVVFNIFAGAQNTNGTIYTFQVNDDSPEQIYTHEQLINLGGTFNSTLGQWIFQVTHNFTNVSCSTDSNINSQVYYNSFQASVTVSNPCGTSSNSNGPYYIQSKPEANFTSNPANNTICINSTVLFTDTTINGSNITPHGPGIDFECDDNYKKYWTIEGPSGLITVGMSGIIPTNIFINVTGNLGFNFGLPNNPEDWTSTATNTLQVTFLQPGTYTITLYTGSNVCGVTSETQTICVTPEVTADFTLNPSTGCTPTTVQIENLSSLPGCDNNTLFNWQVSHTNPENCPNATIPGWSFSSGNETSSEPEITFTSAGVYTIQLTTSLQNAVAGTLCQPDVKTQTITIKDKPRTTLTAQTICEGTTLTLNPTVFNCYASQAVTYLWDFSSNPPTSISSTTVANPTITFATAGTYNYTLTLTNECGSNTFSSSITVNPAVQISASGPSATCLNTNIPLIGSISGGTTSGTWTASITGGTFSPNDTTLSPTYTPPNNYTGTITFTLTSSDPSGPCPAEAISFQVVVNTQATADAGSYNSICENGTIQLNGTVGGAASTGSWTSSNGGSFSDPNSLTSNYSPPVGFTGTIVLTLTTNDPPGPCNPETDTVTLTIIPSHIIASQPTTTQSICVGGTIDPLTVAYTGGVGTATYQWYSNTTNANSGGTLITGATNSSYTPAAFTTAGTYYFYATVTLSGNGCGSTTSNTAEVIVVADPVVDTQALATQTLCQNSIPTDLTISVSGGIGTFNYQWYSNTTNSTTGGTVIPGETNSAYTPPTTTVGTQYYYCLITQSGVGCNVTSAVAQVIIVTAPTITTQPASSSVCENGTPTLLTVAYTNGTGTPTYQWFSNTTNNTIGGTAIAGATADSYSPPSTSVGTLYYYCEITFASGGCTSVLSTTAEVVINPLPTVSTQPTTTQSICVGGTIDPLTVAYTGGVGTATYQWYSNTTNANSGGTLITGATNNSYTPAAFTTAGTYYFYATVTLSGNGCGSTTSNTAEVIVVADPVVDTQALATQTLCQNSIPTDLTISVSGGIGTFNYQWYSNTTNSTSGGTVIPGETNSAYTPPTTTVGTQYYYCLITQSGVGCNVTSAVAQVIIVPAPTITTQPASSSVCENGTPTLLTVAYTNGTGTPTYQWFSNTTNNTIGGTAIAGATADSYSPPSTSVGTLYYYCEITFTSGGCTSVLSTTAEVIINPLPTVSTQPTTTQSICVGGTIDPLTVAYTGGVGTATYQWYSNTTNANSGGTLIIGATNSSYTPAAFTTAGTYYFYATVTLSGNGCGSTTSNTAEVIVVADPVVDTQALATQTLCQNSIPTDLTISVSGGIGTFNYQWYSNTTNSTSGGTVIPGETNSAYTPPTTTVGTQYYYCLITQSGVGCNVTSAVAQVIIVPAPTITTQPASSSVCENGTPTLLTVAYTNGTGTPTYQWFSNTTNNTIGGTAIAGATADSYSPPSTSVGTLYYYCEITFTSGGCTSVLSTTAEVVINQIPVINDVTAIICSGEPYIFNSTNSNDVLPAGLQYSWDLLSMTPSGTISGSVNNGTLQNQFIQQLVNNSNGIATLVYEVTPIAGICTGNPFTITIEVYPRPDVIFDLPIQTICNETNTALVTLNSTLPGNITYNWTATIPTGITGAISSGTNTILVQTLMNNTAVPLTITYETSATFNNNSSSCTGNIYTYSITVNPTFSSSGVLSNYNGYNVSVFGANDGSIDLTSIGGSGVYTYSWVGPNGFTSTNEDLFGLYAGTYTVTISDGYCTPIILTFTLTQPPELLVQSDLSLTINLLCYGDTNGAVGVLITQESVPPYDYQLYDSNGNLVSSIIDSTNLNPQFTGLIAGVYSLTIIDANGGQKTVTGLSVTQPDAIIVTATTTPITCYGANNASITLTATGGIGPYQANWDNLATGFYQNNLAAGDYTIVVTDNSGCTETIVVNIPEAPIFTINPIVTNISCYGANDGSINVNLVGGIQPISLTWNDGSTSGLVRNNLPPGTYTVTIVDSKPCTIIQTFNIIEPQPLILSANIQNALDCNDANSGAVNLLVSGGTPPFTYSWTNGTTTEDLTNIPAGNYAVVVTDSNGCTQSAQYSVNRPQPLTLNVVSDTNVNCETKDISQVFEAQVSGGVPPVQLSWSSGTVTGVNNEFMTTNQDGFVILTATDAVGCTTTYSSNVAIPVIGNESFNQTSFGYTAYGLYAILDPIQFTNTSTGDYASIVWNFGDGTFSNEENPIHTYVQEGDYVVTLTVTYPFGCVYNHTISLRVEKGYLLVVPTAFTPNNDTLNDTFRPVTRGLKNVRLDVYDTWGSLIYSETGDVLSGWDGTIKGVKSENGNYNCKISAETFYGKIITAEETFVLIK